VVASVVAGDKLFVGYRLATALLNYVPSQQRYNKTTAYSRL
jgi:hypothetical protein